MKLRAFREGRPARGIVHVQAISAALSSMAEAEGTFVAEALDENNFAYPSNVREVLLKAKTSWLKNTEVCDVLENYVEYGLPVSREPPSRPPGRLPATQRKSERMNATQGWQLDPPFVCSRILLKVLRAS